MAWSDAARRAAAEARRRHAGGMTTRAMDASTGMSTNRTRKELADQIRSTRRRLRTVYVKKSGSQRMALAQLKNYRYEARKSSASLRTSTMSAYGSRNK